MDWQGIDELNGEYEANIYGEIRNSKTKRKLKPIQNSKGYTVVNIYTKTIPRKQYFIHRLIATQFISRPQEKTVVNHKDGNKTNNKVDNLEWVTPAENIIHAIDTGLEKAIKVTTTMKEELKRIDDWEELDKYSEIVGISVKSLRKHTELKLPRPPRKEVIEYEQKIVSMYLELKNVNEVSRMMNTTRDIIYRILSQNNIHKRPNPRQVIVDENAVLKTFVDTRNKAETARIHGIDRSAVYRIIANNKETQGI